MADLEQNTLVKDKTLFIIEDDKPFRERLTTSFQRKDFTVTAAASKKEALDVLAGNNFNYAIVDLRLGCLLYTSPSPRDSDTSRMPSSA